MGFFRTKNFFSSMKSVKHLESFAHFAPTGQEYNRRLANKAEFVSANHATNNE